MDSSFCANFFSSCALISVLNACSMTFLLLKIDNNWILYRFWLFVRDLSFFFFRMSWLIKIKLSNSEMGRGACVGERVGQWLSAGSLIICFSCPGVARYAEEIWKKQYLLTKYDIYKNLHNKREKCNKRHIKSRSSLKT